VIRRVLTLMFHYTRKEHSEVIWDSLLQRLPSQDQIKIASTSNSSMERIFSLLSLLVLSHKGTRVNGLLFFLTFEYLDDKMFLIPITFPFKILQSFFPLSLSPLPLLPRRTKSMKGSLKKPSFLSTLLSNTFLIPMPKHGKASFLHCLKWKVTIDRFCPFVLL